jgi:hypothetical protein
VKAEGASERGELPLDDESKTFAGLRRARVYPCRGPRLPFACPCACYDRIHVSLPLPRERALCVPT